MAQRDVGNVYAVRTQAGRLATVTGSNSGTGREGAMGLAGAGADVVLAVRSVERGEAARAEILAAHPGANVRVRELDLAQLSSIHRFVDGLAADRRPVDLLVNN